MIRATAIVLCVIASLNASSQERLIYHNIQTDKRGKIIPWFSQDPGKSFDHVIYIPVIRYFTGFFEHTHFFGVT